MAQLFGQSEAPMMISTMARNHFRPGGSLARERLSSAGRPSPLVQVAIMDEVSRHGWHHRGDIGYLDAENYLFVVDRAKDMIITGGFTGYSAELEQALMTHPAVRDCAVVGPPDDTWGERITAVVKLQPGLTVSPDEIRGFVKVEIRQTLGQPIP